MLWSFVFSFSGNVEEFDAEHGQHALANEQSTIALFPRLVEHGCEQLDLFVNLSAYDFVISFFKLGRAGRECVGAWLEEFEGLVFLIFGRFKQGSAFGNP